MLIHWIWAVCGLLKQRDEKDSHNCLLWLVGTHLRMNSSTSWSIDHLYMCVIKIMTDDYFWLIAVQHDVIFYLAYDSLDVSTIRNFTDRPIDFANIDFLFRRVPFLSNFNPYTADPTWQKNGKWNYHNMIRFWLMDVFDHPLMDNVDYYMRVDEDSLFQSNLVNVFELMRQRRGNA